MININFTVYEFFSEKTHINQLCSFLTRYFKTNNSSYKECWNPHALGFIEWSCNDFVNREKLCNARRKYKAIQHGFNAYDDYFLAVVMPFSANLSNSCC